MRTMLFSKWNKFWFEPSSPLPMALFRIILGFVLLEDILTMRLPDWRLFYSTHPLIPVSAFMKYWWGREPRFDLFPFLPTDELRLGLLCLYAVFVTFIVLGLFTRTSCLCALLINESMFNHFTLAVSGADVFVKIALMITTFSNAGDMLSLDNLGRALKSDWRHDGFRPPSKPQWSLRTLQLQICFVYAITVMYKMSGAQWLNGSAIYYVSRSEDLGRFGIPILFDHYLLMKLLTWSTLVFESSFVWMVWIKKLRYKMLFLGVLFHLGIEWTCNIPLFETIMIGSYVAFIHPSDLSKVMQFIKDQAVKKLGAATAVLYDEKNLPEIFLTGLIHRLDIFARLQLLTRSEFNATASAQLSDGETGQKSLQVIAGGRALTGFDAFRVIARSVPWGWLISPFLFLPVLSNLCRAAFNFAASRLESDRAPQVQDLASEEREHSRALYPRLIFSILMVIVIGLANLPREIFASQQDVRRVEILDATKVRAFKDLSASPQTDSPAMLKPLATLGWVHLQEKNSADAEKAFLKALSLSEKKLGHAYDSDYAQALLDLAMCYRETNKLAESEKYFLKIRDYDLACKDVPADFQARDLSNLALITYLQSESVTKKEEGHKLLEKALSLCDEAEHHLKQPSSDERPYGNLISIKYFILRNLGMLKAAREARQTSDRILARAGNRTIEP